MTNKIRIVLWGYDKSAEMKLEALLSLPGVIVAAVVVPVNRDKKRVNAIKAIALRHKIKVYEPQFLRNNNAFRKAIASLHPDIFIVDSYTKLIPKSLFELPRSGAYNFHPGRLPEYRGAHVLNWAIINGEEKIALTVHLLNEEFDSGDIVFAEDIKISFLDDINTVFDKVCKAGVLLLTRLIAAVRDDNLKLFPQTGLKVKAYHLRSPDDGSIDWNRNSMQIYNLIRALLPPWPCAFFTYKGRKIRIREAYPVNFSADVEPGVVVGVGRNGFCVSSADNVLLIKRADKMNFTAGEKLN